MSVIKIDGAKYDVGEVELKRDAEIIYDSLTQGVMLDLSEVDDAVATKYSYSFTVELKHSASTEQKSEYDRGQYDAFYYDITSPISVRTVELPFGQSTILFPAKIKTVRDGLLKSYGGANRWSGIRVTFEPVKPQRYNM